MGWLQVIGAALALALEILQMWKEANDEVSARKKEALKDAIDAIHAHDNSALTSAFDRMRS